MDLDLAERLTELSERNAEPLPDLTEPPISDEEAKERFLDALEEGKTVLEAAAHGKRTITWFRRRRQTRSRSYDVDFSNRYEEIMDPEGPNRDALALRAITALVKAMEDGNVRAAEKILAAYHGDFGWLRPQAAQGDINIERFQLLLPNVPTELLMQMREAILAGQQAQLPPA